MIDSEVNIPELVHSKSKRMSFIGRQLMMTDTPASRLVETYLHTNEGRLQSLDGFPMKRAIYDNMPKKLLLKCSRKTLKSTLLSNMITLNAIRYNRYAQLYVAPQESSAKYFSGSYLSVRMDSPPLRRITQGFLKNDVFEKVMNGSMSTTLLRYASDDATRVRGPATDHNFYDEIQDMDAEILPIIWYTMGMSDFQRECYSGTPLTTDNTIEHLWRQSTQYEWGMKCTCCFDGASTMLVKIDGVISVQDMRTLFLANSTNTEQTTVTLHNTMVYDRGGWVVLHCISYSGKKRTVNLQTNGGMVVLTKDHGVMASCVPKDHKTVSRYHEKYGIRMENTETGDTRWFEPSFEEIKVHDLAPKDFVVTLQNDTTLTKGDADFPLITMHRKRYIYDGEIIKVLKHRTERGYVIGFSKKHQRKVKVLTSTSNNNIQFNGYLIGIFLAEGNVIYHKDKAMGISLAQSQTANSVIFNKIEASLISCNIHYSRTSKGFRIFDINIASWFEQFGYLCHNKRVPSFVFQLKETHLLDILAGVVDGDGTINENEYSVRLTSQELIRQLTWICRACGFFVRSTLLAKKDNELQMYSLSFDGRVLPQAKKEVKGDKAYHRYARISSISDESLEDTDVFDVTTSSGTLYVDGVWVHNCNHWNFLRLDNDPMKMIQRKGLCCSKCDTKLDTNAGEWIQFNTGADVEIAGYHLAQPILPYFSNNENRWAEIYKNVHLKDYGIAPIHNEIFGLSFDTGSKPITEEQLRSLCNLGPMLLPMPSEGTVPLHKRLAIVQKGKYQRFACGADWGVNMLTSRTAVCIIGIIDEMHFDVVYCEIIKGYEYEAHIRKIAGLANALNAFCASDAGPDPIRGLTLMEATSPTRTQLATYRETQMVQYTSNPGTDYRQARWVLHRSDTLSIVFNVLKGKKVYIRFPRWEDCAECFGDIMNVFVETKQGQYREEMRYSHKPDCPDDFIHALNFGLMQALLCTSNSLLQGQSSTSNNDSIAANV